VSQEFFCCLNDLLIRNIPEAVHIGLPPVFQSPFKFAIVFLCSSLHPVFASAYTLSIVNNHHIIAGKAEDDGCGVVGRKGKRYTVSFLVRARYAQRKEHALTIKLLLDQGSQ